MTTPVLLAKTYPSVLVCLLMVTLTRADYPSTPLDWTSCGTKCFQGALEFCQDGTAYGYRKVGEGGVCGATPGPLIRMTPGNTYKLTLHNSAPQGTKTNIHTHGLHIVGAGDSDNVYREVDGGLCLDYTWDIAANHPPGTNWYHPHLHGMTNVQTGGGAFGMLIIEDDPNENTLTLPDNEKLLQISALTKSVLGNGNTDEVLEFENGRWYRLRVSVVTPTAKPKALTFDGGCEVYKVASDGVWHTKNFNEYPGPTFSVTGASRADFAIKCTGTGTVSWGPKLAASFSVVGFLRTRNLEVLDLGEAPPRSSSLTGILEASVPQENVYDVSLNAATINGVKYPEGLGTIAWNQVHEWKISGSGSHPFHLHLYHMLIVEPTGCEGDYKFGEFYDTLSTSSKCTVRFKTADFGQRMVMVSK